MNSHHPDDNLLQTAQLGALANDGRPSHDSAVVKTTADWSLLPVEDLRNIMAQFAPKAMADVELIQKGVENFFLFNQEPNALVSPNALKYLTRTELQILEERNAIVRYEYLGFDSEADRLLLKTVLIRPASLKGEQVERVKEACVRHSVSIFLEYIHKWDENARSFAKEGRLGDWVASRVFQSPAEEWKALDIKNRTDLLKIFAALRRLSIEHFLGEECKVPLELLAAMLAMLNQRAKALLEFLSSFKEPSETLRGVLESRGELSFLIELGADFHILQPPGSMLIELKEQKIREYKSETEWILDLYVQIAAHVLRILLPQEDFEKLDGLAQNKGKAFLAELQKHPSFYQGEDWEGGASFLQAFSVLLKQGEILSEVRREYLLRVLMQKMIEKLNMRFEPWLFTPEELSMLPEEAFDYISKEDVFSLLSERMRSIPDLYSTEERREQKGAANIYFLYKSNVPRAFSKSKKTRNFLHLLCKENGQQNGIYDSLIDTSLPNLPEEILDEQIALGRAIRTWEEDLEKERQRRLKESLGVWARILLFLKSLFGLAPTPARRAEDREAILADEEAQSREKPSTRKRKERSHRKDTRPKERVMIIPQKVQKAIDFVERHHHGLVWIDEVLYALGSVKFTEGKISDMLYFDKKNRYREIRSLKDIRPLFIQERNLSDKRWISSTKDYLENITNKRREHEILFSYLSDLLAALS